MGTLKMSASFQSADRKETSDQLAGHTVLVTINRFTYHPQTQDVLQWFTRETPSSALGGLYRKEQANAA